MPINAHAHPAGLPDDALISTKQVAEWLQCSVAWLEACRSRGHASIPFIRLEGGRIRYSVRAVRVYLAALDEFTGTFQYETHSAGGPGRPRRTRVEPQP